MKAHRRFHWITLATAVVAVCGAASPLWLGASGAAALPAACMTQGLAPATPIHTPSPTEPTQGEPA